MSSISAYKDMEDLRLEYDFSTFSLALRNMASVPIGYHITHICTGPCTLHGSCLVSLIDPFEGCLLPQEKVVVTVAEEDEASSFDPSTVDRMLRVDITTTDEKCDAIYHFCYAKSGRSLDGRRYGSDDYVKRVGEEWRGTITEDEEENKWKAFSTSFGGRSENEQISEKWMQPEMSNDELERGWEEHGEEFMASFGGRVRWTAEEMEGMRAAFGLPPGYGEQSSSTEKEEETLTWRDIVKRTRDDETVDDSEEEEEMAEDSTQDEESEEEGEVGLLRFDNLERRETLAGNEEGWKAFAASFGGRSETEENREKWMQPEKSEEEVERRWEEYGEGFIASFGVPHRQKETVPLQQSSAMEKEEETLTWRDIEVRTRDDETVDDSEEEEEMTEYSTQDESEEKDEELPSTGRQLGMSVHNGVVFSVQSDGPADRAGVRGGHRIVEINGQNVEEANHERIMELLETAPGNIHLKVILPVDEDEDEHDGVVAQPSLLSILTSMVPDLRPVLVAVLAVVAHDSLPAPVSLILLYVFIIVLIYVFKGEFTGGLEW